MDIQTIHTTLNQITVKRGAGGTTVVSHAEQQPIYLFTDSAFEWRFFSVIFGTIAIVLFFFVCRKLGMSQKATLFATFLFSFEDMSFVHASLALLDVYMVTFMLAGFLFYLHRGYWLSGMSIALSALCKLTGFFAFIAIFLHWLFFRRDKPKWFLSSIAVTGLSFLAFLEFFDYFAFGKLENPIQRTLEMLNLSAANVFTNPPLSISSRPWEWLLPWKWIVYSYDPQYISFISWTIQILIIPIFIYLIYKARKGNNVARFGLLWFIFTYLIWIPLNIATNRVSFVFYFYPTTPAICIGIGLALSDIIDKLKTQTAQLGRVTAKVRANYVGIGLYLAFHLAMFIVFNPAVPVLIKLWLPPFAL
jgi:dolichyl-phosphate-mannose-protein mannosyltransferase